MLGDKSLPLVKITFTLSWVIVMLRGFLTTCSFTNPWQCSSCPNPWWLGTFHTSFLFHLTSSVHKRLQVANHTNPKQFQSPHYIPSNPLTHLLPFKGCSPMLEGILPSHCGLDNWCLVSVGQLGFTLAELGPHLATVSLMLPLHGKAPSHARQPTPCCRGCPIFPLHPTGLPLTSL